MKNSTFFKKHLFVKFWLPAGIFLLTSGNAPGQSTLYFGGSGTWTDAVWSIADGGPYTTAWTSGSNAVFNVQNSTVSFATTYVNSITANENVTVTPNGTLSTGDGTIRTPATVTVASGKLFDLGSQGISATSATGFIKNGDGILALNGSGYSGGFTLNAGTLVVGGVNALGTGLFTINGGILAAKGNIDLSNKPSGIVINADFTLGSSSLPAVSSVNLTFNAATSLGTNFNRTITLGGTGTYTLGGIISGLNSGLNLNALTTGVLLLAGTNTYSGTTTVTAGTLRLGTADAIPVGTGGGVIFNGGTVSTGSTTGFSEGAANSADMGTLTLSANSAIALGTGDHSLFFANSSAVTWTEGTTLTISGWSGTAGSGGTAGKIFVGSDATGLAADQLAKINFSGYASGAQILSTGEVVPFLLPAAAYTWQGADGGDWQAASDWIPVRTAPASNDILLFTDGTTKAVTNVPAQTIGQLKVRGNTSVTLQASGANTLIIAGSTGDDLSVETGSQLNISGANPLIIALSSGATGSIYGSMDFSTASNQVTAADASGLTFNSGAVFTQNTGNTGNVFGSGTANSVIFLNGSTFIQYGGSNPFSKTAPASVTVFNTGSLFKIKGSLYPAFNGRTYSNLEIDAPGSNFSPTGSSAVTMDNLTVTNGTLNFNVTGTPGHSIKGDITVASGAILNFAPASAGTVNLNGAAQQSILGTGTVVSGANSTLDVNSSAGVVLDNHVNLTGNLAIANGTLTLNPGKQLTVTGTAANNGTINLLSDAANGTATITGAVSGNGIVNQAVGSPRTYYIGVPVGTSPVLSNVTGIAAFDVAADVWSAITTPGSSILTPGLGYLFQVGSSGTTGISFAGTLNSGDLTVDLFNAGKRFNFLGNPYPSYLDAKKVVDGSNLVEKSIWYRGKDADGIYKFFTYNVPADLSVPSASIDATAVNNGFIPPVQGFWLKVKADAASETFTFTDAMRTHNTTGTAVPLKSPQAVFSQILRLQVSNGTVSDETVILFNENAQSGYDSYDAPKMMNTGSNALNIYTRLGSETLVLNSWNAIPYDTAIPVEIQTPAAGTYTVSAGEFSNFDAGEKVLLIDGSVVTNLTQSDYTFTADTGNPIRQLSVVFPGSDVSSGVATSTVNDISVFVRNSHIVVSAGTAAPGTFVYVFNSMGQQLAAQPISSTVNEVGGQYQPGVYLVRVNNHTAKVIVK